MKLMFATPTSNNTINVKYHNSIIGSIAVLHKLGISYESNFNVGSIIAYNRNMLVHEFLQSDCTHLLFVDSDICWAPDDFYEFIKVAKKVDILSGHYPRTDLDITSLDCHNLDYLIGKEYFDTSNIVHQENGINEVLYIATGFLCISKHVFTTINNLDPNNFIDHRGTDRIYRYFDYLYRDHQYIGEDLFFSELVRKAGFKLLVDTFMTCGHVNNSTFICNTNKLTSY